MSLNSESVEHTPAGILSRMRAEVEAIVEGAPAVWEACLTQAGEAKIDQETLVLTGCGDSYYAGLATRHALEAMLEKPVVAWPAMEVTAYPSRLLRSADLVAVSVSGKVGRTIDAVAAHTARGGRAVAVTTYADSDLGTRADAVVATGVRGTPGPVPGTANYVASLLGLLALGATNGTSAGRVEEITSVLALLPEVLERSVAFCAEAVKDVAAPVFAAGSGPDFGTANLAVAKLLEAAGTAGVAQDLEEWAHEQYFVTRPGSTVLVLGHDPDSVSGARQVCEMVSAIGARAVAVGNDADPLVPDALVLPAVAAGLSPLLTWVPAAVFALEFALHHERFPFGIDTPGRMATVDRNIYVPSPNRM